MNRIKKLRHRSGSGSPWVCVLTIGLLLLGGCGRAAGNLSDIFPEGGSGTQESASGDVSQDGNAGGKQTLTLGTILGSWDGELLRVIEAYNAQSEKYYVEHKDYMEGATGNIQPEDIEQAKNRMMMELASGKGPDLISMNSFEKESLGAAGVLADLYSLQSREEWEAKIDGNLLDSLQTGDKLFACGPRFRVETVAAGKEIGGENGWTMEELMDAFEERGKGPEALVGFFADMSVLETLAQAELDSYIDWDRGKADFACESFYRILEFDKAYQERQHEHVPRSTALKTLRSGEGLASLEIIFGVEEYQHANLLYGGDMVIKGFPTPEGTGVCMEIVDAMGIYAAGNQEGAWDFMQYYLREYGDRELGIGTAGFAMERELREQELAKAMIQKYDDAGQPIAAAYDDDTEIYAATSEDVEAVRELIGMVDRESVRDSAIMQILTEEASAYTQGNASAETVARNCSNRVNLYLAEMKEERTGQRNN